MKTILDELPKQEKMRPTGWSDVRFFDRSDVPWAAVKNFFSSRTGQNWDDVYSEFCHKFRFVSQSHRQVAEHYVEFDTYMQNGKVMADIGYRHEPVCVEISSNFRWWGGFYIHPETKTLVKTKNIVVDYEAKCREERAKYFRYLGPWHQYLKHKGIWYEVHIIGMSNEVLAIAKKNFFGFWESMKENEPIDLEKMKWQIFGFNFTLRHYSKTVRFFKRQLNRSELRKNGLTNG